MPGCGRRARTLVAMWLPLSLMTGCLAAPRPLSSFAAKAAPSGADDAVKRAAYPAGPDQIPPDSVLARGKRVVITAFDVELIDLQFQPPLKKQMIFKPMPIPFGPMGFAAAGVELIGLGRRNTRIPEEDQRKLTSELYAAFVADLKDRGVDVVSQETLTASPNFARLAKKTIVNSSPLLLLNPLGSDTGQVMHTRTIAAPGLGVRRRWSPGATRPRPASSSTRTPTSRWTSASAWGPTRRRRPLSTEARSG